MNNNAYNTVLVVLILIIMGGGYVILSQQQYKENVATPFETPAPALRQEPVNTTPTPEPVVEQTPQSESPKPVVAAQAIETTLFKSETVRYTAEGFSPRTIAIARGTQVTFVNETDTQMYVAAAPYPTHSSLPAFNQRRASGKGGIYSFTFTEKGAFNYQNDMTPGFTGSIIVTE